MRGRRNNGHQRGNRGNRGRGRGGHHRGRGRGRGNQLQAAESGNQRERIAIESGHLVLIDQFMLANPQFTAKLVETQDADFTVRDELIRNYGGEIVELTPGTYRISRDPFKCSIVIHPEGDELREDELSRDSTDETGHVFIDTRCVAMIDRELLDDTALLDKYQQLWFGGQDKACRDLIRDNGGAVRYGFGRYGDELGVFTKSEADVVCLWPDLAEEVAGEGAEAQ